ncbi:STM3941 family protein [Nitrospirillum pindoramense]|uniref:PH (Pleckstrin Homology) domain-containing protein n=1 Tax=Nitrospirillum amazonense TaxID=28077 RepID=A0A560GIA4_9PROT|nr:STM3941 family protein [Nitrospirillum amazonense]TWB33636.1 hypothetical protein FBZ90_13014 [Nitrospirillum amazonense]
MSVAPRPPFPMVFRVRRGRLALYALMCAAMTLLGASVVLMSAPFFAFGMLTVVVFGSFTLVFLVIGFHNTPRFTLTDEGIILSGGGIVKWADIADVRTGHRLASGCIVIHLKDHRSYEAVRSTMIAFRRPDQTKAPPRLLLPATLVGVPSTMLAAWINDQVVNARTFSQRSATTLVAGTDPNK